MKEKIIALLNQTGTPLQDWCTDIVKSININDITRYRILTEQPYTWPLSNGPLLGHPGSIDLIAISFGIAIPKSRYSICLVVECKKADSRIKNWIFPEVPEIFRYPQPYFLMADFKKDEEKNERPKFFLKSEITFPELDYSLNSSYESFVQGFEFNEKLTSISKDQTEKMYNYLKQVNTGLRALINTGPLNETILTILQEHEKMIFIPVLVTTADLYSVQFNPKNVILPEGEINPAQTELSKKKWVTYQFPLPDYLQFSRGIERMTTFIVNANYWRDFLEKIQEVRVVIS